MVTTYGYALVSVMVVSLLSFAGLLVLSLKETVVRKCTFVFISIAVGALLGDAFIHLIPETFEAVANPTLASILIIGGILVFFVLEKFLHWHHHGQDAEDGVHPVGKLVILSDGVHNFIDGVIIAASFFVSVPLGLATTLAVILHEIPQEVGDFSVLLHAGYSKMRALWLNFASALTALVGALFFFVLGEQVESALVYVLPIAAGGFIYIALTDLIPELQKTKNVTHSFYQLCAVILGIAFMVMLTWVE